jgi:hypothetical protein
MTQTTLRQLIDRDPFKPRAGEIKVDPAELEGLTGREKRTQFRINLPTTEAGTMLVDKTVIEITITNVSINGLGLEVNKEHADLIQTHALYTLKTPKRKLAIEIMHKGSEVEGENITLGARVVREIQSNEDHPSHQNAAKRQADSNRYTRYLVTFTLIVSGFIVCGVLLNITLSYYLMASPLSDYFNFDYSMEKHLIKNGRQASLGEFTMNVINDKWLHYQQNLNKDLVSLLDNESTVTFNDKRYQVEHQLTDTMSSDRLQIKPISVSVLPGRLLRQLSNLYPLTSAQQLTAYRWANIQLPVEMVGSENNQIWMWAGPTIRDRSQNKITRNSGVFLPRSASVLADEFRNKGFKSIIYLD